MKQKIVLLLCLVLITTVLMSCVSNTQLKSSFWEDTNMKVGIIIEELPPAGAHKAGSQGLLDVAINSALANELQKHLKDFDVSVFLQIRERLVERIEAGGMTTVVIDDFLITKDLPKITGEDGMTKPDYSYFKKNYGVDYILVVNISAVGTIRKYYGFIPLGDPSGYCLASGQLMKTEDNKKYWSYTNKNSVVKVEGKWNEPPDYPNLTVAINKAISNAVTDIVDNF